MPRSRRPHRRGRRDSGGQPGERTSVFLFKAFIAILFSDLIGKLDVLRVTCSQCGRDGCYGLSRLITQRGRDAKIIDWLDELTAECPKKIARNMNDPCGAKCPQLPKVL